MNAFTASGARNVALVDPSGNPVFAGAFQPTPPIVGFGILAVSAASVALSTLTVGPSSAAWAMPLAGHLFLKNSEKSAGFVYVAPLGGTCDPATCIPIAPGASWGFNLGTSSTAPTLIADSTATVIVQW